jgi:hypothetical protein
MIAQEDTSKPPDSGIVWLASYPKSGNTWTRAYIANLATIMGGEEEALDVNSINRFTLGENSTNFYKEVCGFEPKADDYCKIANNRHRVQKAIADQFEGLIFCKTHNALVMDRGQPIINFAVTSGAVYIVRNPLDVAISLSHHMNLSVDQAIEVMATRDLETPINETRVHEVWGSWSQHVKSWTRKVHSAIYVMRYEEMLSEPEKAFGELARHLLLNPTAAELRLAIERSSFDSLKDRESQEGFKERPEHAERFFREGRAGQWKEILTPQQVDAIVSKHSEQMMKFGYLP